MKTIRIESLGISYCYERCVGVGGVEQSDVDGLAKAADAADAAFKTITRSGEAAGMSEAVLWAQLDGGESLAAAREWAEGARVADAVVSVGIGGSYLGNRVLRDALLGTHFNALPRSERKNAPELHFAGFHLDPREARGLVELFKAKAQAKAEGPFRCELLAISKSGTTTETLATTLALRNALGAVEGLSLGFAVLTAPTSTLAKLAAEVPESTVIPFPSGIGGRFSVLSAVGLVTAAVSGVDVDELLAGARAARDFLLESGGDLTRNPALLYATIHHLHGGQGRSAAVFMPYSERLRCVSEWYVQLLAESLGKARDRSGVEVYAGRTPIVAVGTTDMHAQTQQHQEGALDKTVTTLDVKDWGAPTAADRVPDLGAAGKLAGKTFASLNTLAREANEEALASSGRPSDSWILDTLDARTLGGLLTLLMASVCYEGELLDVCTFDQPGVEAYKAIMRKRL